MKFKCRIVSQQFHAVGWDDFTIDDVFYSPRLALKEADALIVLYDPSEELLEFKGPKLWFTIEPSWHHHFHRHPVGKRLMKVLDSSVHIFYGNPDPKYRVPHPTYRNLLTMPRVSPTKPAAVACVSNFGGRAWFLKRHIRLRNRMILCPLVQLFGKPELWARFRHFPQLWIQHPPLNFQGRTSPGKDERDEEHIRFLSGYKVCVCLENCVEPDYFTEKFVNAARAGCIPVYHAHPSVRKRFLTDAKWVDPVDFGFSPQRTIAYALAQDQNLYRRVNDVWLASGVLADTDDQKVFPMLHKIMKAKLETKEIV
jgi:Glycosyltransferase family 10 (fucosyltransferase) C-term